MTTPSPERPGKDDTLRRGEAPTGGWKMVPAITYSRPLRTTIGPGCLTAVFGMGTGRAIQVCSPGLYQQVAVEGCLHAYLRSEPRSRCSRREQGQGKDQCGKAIGC